MRTDRPPLGRRAWRGVGVGPRVTLAPRSSLLIVGPTQVGKTSSLVVPAILEWTDSLVVASVKRDVVATTRAWRESLGEVQVLEPGEERGLTWDPLEGVNSLRQALRVARDLTVGAGNRGDTDFWNALAAKFVAALFTTARTGRRDVFDAALAVEARDFHQWLARVPPGEAADLLRNFLDHDPKTLDGVLTTAETMLLPWRFRQPLARVDAVLDGPHTLYLCAARHQQRHYEPLFRGALRRILEVQQQRVEEGRQRRLLVVLDEAASVAPLEELDQLAATVSGLDVTLVTVVQDFAQLRARWGDRAPTIVNNHTTRVVLGGLADPTVGAYLPELVAHDRDAPPPSLRQRPIGFAQVVAGRDPVVEVRLRPWWRRRRWRRRAPVPVVTTMRW